MLYAMTTIRCRSVGISWNFFIILFGCMSAVEAVVAMGVRLSSGAECSRIVKLSAQIMCSRAAINESRLSFKVLLSSATIYFYNLFIRPPIILTMMLMMTMDRSKKIKYCLL